MAWTDQCKFIPTTKNKTKQKIQNKQQTNRWNNETKGKRSGGPNSKHKILRGLRKVRKPK